MEVVTQSNQEAHQLVGEAKRCATKIDPKQSEVAFGPFFSNFYNCRPEVADDVISSVAVDYICMDVHVNFGDSMLNVAELFGSLPVGPVLPTYMKYSFAFCCWPEAASHVISGKCIFLTGPDKLVQFRDPRLNYSVKIRSKVVRDGIFGGIFELWKWGLEVSDDLLSNLTIDKIGMDVRLKLGDSMLLNSRRIIILFADHTHFAHFCAAFCSWLEADSDVISGRFVRPIVLDKWVKFRDPRLNSSWEIPPEAVGGGIFDSFFAIASDRK